MGSAMLSVTQQMDAIEQNNRCLAIDDEQGVLDYYSEVFRPTTSGSEVIWQSLLEVVGDEPEQELDQTPQFSISVALSGEAGVQLAEQALADHLPLTVALIDMRMPGGLDGLETAQQLRLLDPRIMLVIVTAYSDYKLEEIQSRLLNNVLYLNKPLTSDEVLQTVRMLNQSWKEREKTKILKMQMVSHAKMAGLGTMAVRIGHEINQPLSYINGIFQLLKMELQRGGEVDLTQLAEEVDLALEQTVRIKEIITSLRVFAHPDRSKRYAVDLADAVEHVQRLFTGQLKKGGVSFDLDIPEKLPPVHFNPSQFQRILTNLISNALDALEEQRRGEKGEQAAPRIHLAASQLPEGKVEMIFEDNGPGVAEELIDRMFDPFVTTKEPGKGTGLGLSEIHGMLNEHGATIAYHPCSGHSGVCFVIHFSTDEESVIA